MTTGIIASVVVLVAVATVAAWVYVVPNVERPKYKLVRSSGTIEIRDYPALLTAEVVRQGTRWEAVRAGFRPLANYIFAKTRAGEKIAMTAPVTQERIIGDTAPSIVSNQWRVRFIMPSKYELSELPSPESSDVQITTIEARRVAAIRFSGVANDNLIDEKLQELRAWLAAQRLVEKGPPTFAYYNDPITPGFLRRNEVIIPILPAA